MQFALVGASLAVVLTAFVAYGLAFTQHSQSGGFLNWLKGQAVDIAKFTVWATEQVVPLTAFILHEVGHAFNTVYSKAADWLSGLENYIQMTGGAFVNLGLALNDWSKWLVKTYIPNLVHGVTAPVTRITHLVDLKLKALEKLLVRALPIAFPGLWQEWEFLRKHWKALVKILAMVGAITVGLPGLLDKSLRKWIDKELSSLWKRVKAKEKQLTAAAFAALLVAALRRMGLSWIRCNNFKRIGRDVCKLSPGSVTSLLGLIGGLALIQGNFSIEKLAREMLAIEKEMVGVIAGAFSELDGIPR